MSELVHKLAKGEHKVIFRPMREDAVQELKECVDRKYVHIKFTETRGGTELGVQLDDDRTDLSKVDWEKEQGIAHFEGDLTLDYVKVRCVADLNLATLEGKGHLEILEEEDESEAADDGESEATDDEAN